MMMMIVNEVEIYYADLSGVNESEWELLKESLPWEERKEAVKAFYRIADKHRCIAAGTILHRLLLQKGVCDFTLKYNDYQKPRLAKYPSLYFNLSHSGSYVMCAISSCPVGIDVEETTSADKMVAQHCFTASENLWLNQGQNYNEKFTRLWTLKESYIKMKGKGLNIPLNSFEILPNEKIFPSDAVFTECKLPGYCAAVCAERGVFHSPEEISFRRLSNS